LEAALAKSPVLTKVGVALWLLITLAPLWRLSAGYGREPAVVTAYVIGTFCWASYLTVASLRMSRWPILLNLAYTAALSAWMYYNTPHVFDRYPRLGPFVKLAPVLLVAALLLSQWKRMNWRILGLSPAQGASRIAGHFE